MGQNFELNNFENISLYQDSSARFDVLRETKESQLAHVGANQTTEPEVVQAIAQINSSRPLLWWRL